MKKHRGSRASRKKPKTRSVSVKAVYFNCAYCGDPIKNRPPEDQFCSSRCLLRWYSERNV